MWKVLTVAIAASLAACTLDEPQTAESELGPGAETEAKDCALAAPDCLAEDDCDVHPEQTLGQCLAACEAGAEAMAVFCRFIVHPAIAAACWKVVNAGPQACANFCYWYFTP